MVSELIITPQESYLSWWYTQDTNFVLRNNQNLYILRIILRIILLQVVEDTIENIIIILLYRWINLEFSAQVSLTVQ